LVDNGETVVLGGIFEQENLTQTKVPFLGDLPYVGKLFRRDLKTDKNVNYLFL
jgi:type IV pilus assembly protein PilQ